MNVALERIVRSHSWLTRPFWQCCRNTLLFVRVGKSRRGFFHGAHADPASTRFPRAGWTKLALELSRDGPNSCSHGGLAMKRPVLARHASGRAAAKLPRHRKKISVSFANVRLQEEQRCETTNLCDNSQHGSFQPTPFILLFLH
jgi:hypothetical protein